jgi:hypothetical protein
MKTYTTDELRRKYQEFMVENWVDNSHTGIGDEFCDYLDSEEPERPTNDQGYGC